MYQSSDLLWIKSVTRDNGSAWAYMEYTVGDIFYLNFSKNPKWYPTNYLKAKPNQLICLFQSIKPTNKKEKYDWRVTHLVAPIDNEVQMDPHNHTHPYIRLVCVVGKIDSPNPIIYEDWSFYKCNRGQICSLKTIERRNAIDFTIAQKEDFIWGMFQNKNLNLDKPLIKLSHNLESEGFLEGAEVKALRVHKFYERNPNVIKRAKELAILENRLSCEVCTFDFSYVYPKQGDGFIECHHKTPISNGVIRLTNPDDLALVCSNCHRMLHRKNADGNYYTVEELKILIEENRQ